MPWPAGRGVKRAYRKDTVHQNEGRFYEAELYRLYGELSLRLGERESGRMGEKESVASSPSHLVALSSPEACFLKAIDITRKQQAKSRTGCKFYETDKVL
jgi:hypothetical protein